MTGFLSKLIAVLGMAASDPLSVHVTQVKKDDFQLQLPSDWRQLPVSDGGLFQFANKSDSYRLSVSVLVPLGMSDKDISQRLDQFLTTRIKVEHDVAGANVKLSASKIESQGNGLVATYSGSQNGDERRFLAFVVINSKRLVCFYLEGLDVTQPVFEQDSRRIVGSVQVVN